MHPRAFLDLANKLFAQEKTPAGRRSAVSRAYYAAFNVTTQFFIRIGLDMPNDAKGHELAYEYLNNCKDHELEELATDFGYLRDNRNDADYRLSKTQIENEGVVKNWLKVATNIIEKLEGCDASNARRYNVQLALQQWKTITRR